MANTHRQVCTKVVPSVPGQCLELYQLLRHTGPPGSDAAHTGSMDHCKLGTSEGEPKEARRSFVKSPLGFEVPEAEDWEASIHILCCWQPPMDLERSQIPLEHREFSQGHTACWIPGFGFSHFLRNTAPTWPALHKHSCRYFRNISTNHPKAFKAFQIHKGMRGSCRIAMPTLDQRSSPSSLLETSTPCYILAI